MPDRLTLVAISALAYIVEVALHEHLGHAVSCIALGSRVLEFGAFYVNCDSALLSPAGARLVALAGPAVSLMTGIGAFALLGRIPVAYRAAWYLTWLTGALGLMTATGYPLFSGISGLGDFGTTPDGALSGATPEWLWRVALTVAGAVGYSVAVRYAVRVLDPHASGALDQRLRDARRVMLTSYLTGAVVYVTIGFLNPYGLVIVATSALAASMGGTSGLLWMFRRMDRSRIVPPPGLAFARSWAWIAVSVVVVAAYAALLGPTIR